jgi:hypothetical protein
LEQAGEASRLAGMGSRVDMPIVLLVATERWHPTARIGMALAEAGCVVDAVCPSGHPIQLTRAVRQMYKYKGLRPLASLSDAIRTSRPNLVIPADDLATWHLHELSKRQGSRGTAGTEICSLIERSLGSADSFPVVSARNAFMQVAREEGVRVPETMVIANASDLHGWIARMGFPMVLKANGTSGGDGVKVVNTVGEAERGFRKLQSPPLLARAVKRAVIDGDLTLLRPSLFRHRSVVSAQTFVTGREATTALFCWQGKVLASLHFEVLQKVGSMGHATVVHRVDNEEMATAAEKIAARLRLSGFHGLDFMIEDGTGRAYLIEINPRTTQVGHLSLGPDRDLPAALYSAVTGKKVQPASEVTENPTIALFPQEWKRDPNSEFLFSCYHDVPWAELGLLGGCVAGNKGRKLATPPADSWGPRGSNESVSRTDPNVQCQSADTDRQLTA